MTKNELKEFLPFLMRERDYIEIPLTLGNIIKGIEGYASECALENASGTINWKSETLPDCKDTNVRIWTRQDWDITDNVRRKRRAQDEIDRAKALETANRVAEMRESIIGHFLKMNLTREMITSIVIGKDASNEKITETYAALKAGGAKLD